VNKPSLRVTVADGLVSVQDVTEDSKSPGGSGQSEDGEDESALLSDRGDELPTGKVEAAEGKQQQTAAAVASVASAVAPPRRAAVSPPPRRAAVSPPPRRAVVSPPPRRAAVSPPPRRAVVSPPPRRAVVSPPPKVPLKLLPRLGSLDREFLARTHHPKAPLVLQQCSHADGFPSQMLHQFQLRSLQPLYPGTSLFPKTPTAPC